MKCLPIDIRKFFSFVSEVKRKYSMEYKALNRLPVKISQEICFNSTCPEKTERSIRQFSLIGNYVRKCVREITKLKVCDIQSFSFSLHHTQAINIKLKISYDHHRCHHFIIKTSKLYRYRPVLCQPQHTQSEYSAVTEYAVRKEWNQSFAQCLSLRKSQIDKSAWEQNGKRQITFGNATHTLLSILKNCVLSSVPRFSSFFFGFFSYIAFHGSALVLKMIFHIRFHISAKYSWCQEVQMNFFLLQNVGQSDGKTSN